MANPLFDTQAKSRHLSRARARAAQQGAEHALFLHHDIAQDIAQRLHVFAQDFQHIAVLRDLGVDWAALLSSKAPEATIRTLGVPPLDLNSLTLEPASQDLIIAPLVLHWVDQLPDMLLALRLALKPKGILIGAMFGGGSLVELKQCLTEAEDMVSGGVNARVSPTVDLRTLAALLQSAGFTMPVVDVDRMDLRYKSALKLVKDLSDAGEGNALSARSKTFLTRKLLMAMAQVYHQRFEDDQGLIPVRCEVLHFSATA